MSHLEFLKRMFFILKGKSSKTGECAALARLAAFFEKRQR